MITDFKKRSLPFWGWFLWFISVPLVTATIYNTHHLWPRLLVLAILSGLTILGSGIMLMAHTMEIVPAVRNKALLGDLIMVASLIVSIGFHAAAGRSVDTAESSRAEQQENQERANRFQEDAARRQKDLLLAEANRDQAAYRRTLAEIERAKRAGTAPPRAHRRNGQSLAPDLTANAPQIEAITASPNAKKEWWQPYVLAALLVELLAAIGGPLWVYHERVVDRDGNGIPEFVETMWELDPDRVRREYPHLVKKLQERGRGDSQFVASMENSRPNA